jgi:hypothetical protein
MLFMWPEYRISGATSKLQDGVGKDYIPCSRGLVKRRLLPDSQRQMTCGDHPPCIPS